MKNKENAVAYQNWLQEDIDFLYPPITSTNVGYDFSTWCERRDDKNTSFKKKNKSQEAKTDLHKITTV